VPEPNPDYPLDFAALRRDRLGDPATWPAPFRLAEDDAGAMREIEPGHFIRTSTQETREAA
jgi:peptide/nickel transport system ATP-binding protein